MSFDVVEIMWVSPQLVHLSMIKSGVIRAVLKTDFLHTKHSVCIVVVFLLGVGFRIVLVFIIHQLFLFCLVMGEIPGLGYSLVYWSLRDSFWGFRFFYSSHVIHPSHSFNNLTNH